MAVRKAPYKDFLQPALQRRFSLTAAALLVASYLESVILANWASLLWAWFPLGPAGFRTFFIFVCGLAILVLRIAHYHVGLRTTGFGIHQVTAFVTDLKNYETAFWYAFSSLGYCPIFFLATPESANLAWTTKVGGDRRNLNERPIFLMCYMGTAALVQTWLHFQNDFDRLDLGRLRGNGSWGRDATGGLASTVKDIANRLPAILSGAVARAIISLPLTMVVYYGFLRSFLWGWTLAFFRLSYNLPKTNMLPSNWPLSISLIGRCLYAGTLIFFLWAVGNVTFSAFMVKEPLKNGKPLTAESKDPNGSLLNGLKSKKLSVKCFAMWELAHISESFQANRQAIYQDIDRKDGPMWSQVYAICMEAVKSIETRVDDYDKPAVPPPVAQAEEPKARVSAPLRDEQIFTSSPQAPSLQNGIKKAVYQAARSPGSTPAAQLSPLAKKTWSDAKDRLLSKGQQDALSPNHLRGQFGQLAVKVLSIDFIGDLLRQEFRLRFASTVLGTPYAEPTLHADAVTALCNLAVKSLEEDAFGNVHRDVPSIVRTLTATIRKVEGLKARFPLHWTDTKKVRRCPEVDQVLDAMRTGLSAVVASFEPYSSDLRLSLADVRHAKEAAAKPPVEEEKKSEPKQKETRQKVTDRRSDMEQVRQSGRVARA